jgi:hypothetical protein
MPSNHPKPQASSAASSPSALAELRVQVHPDRVPTLDLALLRKEFEALASNEQSVTRFKIEEGEDQGRYMNLVFETVNKAQLWHIIHSRLFRHASLGEPMSRASMVLCTGPTGWDDYLLLHHYDPAVQINELPEP